MPVTEPPAEPTASPLARAVRGLDSLSARLFAITFGAILFIEALIFVPSVSNLRTTWLMERVQSARIAALALEAAPARAVSEELSGSLLMSAEVLAVAELEDDMRIQLLAPSRPIDGTMRTIDLRDSQPWGRAAAALSEYWRPNGEILIVLAEGSAPGRVIEVVIPQAPLKAGLVAFALRIAGLSLLIALVAAVVIYFVLHLAVVEPMRRVTVSVEQFSRDPGGWTQRLSPTRRRDEIGRAQNALAGMQAAVADAFRQRAHLAALGAAVAKINHDLRNSLAAARLVSDSLARSDDPKVRRTAPRLERALERAIDLATATLDYGKAAPRPARLQPVRLSQVIAEAADEALAGKAVRLVIDIPETCEASADPDHLYRIAANLLRNAAEAMSQAGTPEAEIRITRDPRGLGFSDNGPGLPETALAHLFEPFSGSGRSNGTGLGLVIARELAEAMGGNLVLESTGPSGTTFRLGLQTIDNG